MGEPQKRSGMFQLKNVPFWPSVMLQISHALFELFLSCVSEGQEMFSGKFLQLGNLDEEHFNHVCRHGTLFSLAPVPATYLSLSGSASGSRNALIIHYQILFQKYALAQGLASLMHLLEYQN